MAKELSKIEAEVPLSKMQEYIAKATILLKSGLLPRHITTPEQACVIAMIGRELSIPMMQAFRKVYVVQGSPALTGELMLSLIHRSGVLEDFKVQKIEDTDRLKCGYRVTMKRRGMKSPHSETFTLLNAKKMNLLNKQNWVCQDETMCKWRAISACARIVCSDVTAGLHTIEEIAPEIEVDEQGRPTKAAEIPNETPLAEPQEKKPELKKIIAAKPVKPRAACECESCGKRNLELSEHEGKLICVRCFTRPKVVQGELV